MKKNVFVVVCLMFVMMFVGCVKKSNNEEKLTNVITELVNYEKSKNVKSVNSEEVLSGIYTQNSYYSIDKLSEMSFDERVNLLDSIENNPNVVYVVVDNKLKSFNDYKNLDDLIINGVQAKTIINLFSEFKNMTTGLSTYPNGTSLKSIEITTLPKTYYEYGEPFNIDGIIVTGTYLDGAKKPITVFKEDFSGFDSKSNGDFRIILTVLGRTTFYDITINSIIKSYDFVLLGRIDFLKLKRYSATISVGPGVDSVLLGAAGGITPATVKVINGVATFPKITMEDSITSITIFALDADLTVIGSPRVISIN